MVKTGIIGLGRMGRYHLNLNDEMSESNLQMLCDADSATRDAVAQNYNYPMTGDFTELLKHVDAVTVAAPTKHHFEIAKKCLESGKHVLVEKPITTNIEQATELFNIAEKKNLVLHIGHVERFNGAVQELDNITDEPYLIESRRVGPYNPNFKNDSIVLDLMIHDIDIILNMVNKNITSVQAHGNCVYSPLPDFATVTIQFEDSCVANILVSRVTQKKDRTMSISQKGAFIYLDYTTQDINIYREAKEGKEFGPKQLKYKNEYMYEKLFVYKDNPLKMEIKHFLDCVTGKQKRNVTVEHELRSLKVALKVDELLTGSNGNMIEVKV
ncbi:MAG: Gfo/Idh/MocA family protein [Deferribacterales bacterium]|jgi:predicted dehydrogenase